MPSKVTLNYNDRSNEPTSVAFYMPTLTGANYDTVTGNGAGNNVGELRAATDVVSLANPTSQSVQAVRYEDAGGLPASPWAQREIGLLVTYVDGNSNKSYQATIPAPDLDALNPDGSDDVPLSNPTFATWITVFEQFAVGPDDGAVTVARGRVIGRKR